MGRSRPKRDSEITLEKFLGLMRRHEQRFVLRFEKKVGEIWAREHPDPADPVAHMRPFTEEEKNQRPREFTRNHTPIAMATNLPHGAEKRDGRQSEKFRPWPAKKRSP